MCKRVHQNCIMKIKFGTITVIEQAKPRGTQVRQLKSRGTSKVGGQCTTHIKAIVNQN